MNGTVRLMPVAIPLMVALGLLWGTGGEVNAAATCPSPAPACTSSGTLINSTLDCTQVRTDNDGSVHVEILKVTLDGAGNMTALIAENNNTSSPTTFSSWSSSAGTYCLNSDDTGFVFPSKGCPLALLTNSTGTEVRLIDSSENRAGAVTCKQH